MSVGWMERHQDMWKLLHDWKLVKEDLFKQISNRTSTTNQFPKQYLRLYGPSTALNSLLYALIMLSYKIIVLTSVDSTLFWINIMSRARAERYDA